MKDFIAQNWQALMGATCTVHVSLIGWMVSRVGRKADKEDVNARFSDISQELIAVRAGQDQQAVSMMELSLQNGRTERRLGEIHATLLALKESSEKEDEHLKALLRR